MSDSEDDGAFESADEGEEFDDVQKNPVESEKDGNNISVAQVSQKCEELKLNDVDDPVKSVSDEEDVESSTDEAAPVEQMKSANSADQTVIQSKNPISQDTPVKSSVESETESFGKETKLDNSIHDVKDNIVHEDNKMPNFECSKEMKCDNVNVQECVDTSKDRKEVAPPSQPRDSAAAALDRLAEQKPAGSWGWGSWGSSILSTATSSVSTFTNSVGEGFNSVLDTVESSIGVPNPEDLVEVQRAGRVKEPQEGSNGTHPLDHQSSSDDADDDLDDELIPQVQSTPPDVDQQSGWFKSWDVSNITGMSKTLVTGGLDVLETIGKKTFDVLAEDVGIRDQIEKRRAKPNLSQVLREAAKDSETLTNNSNDDGNQEQQKTAHFGAMFDEYNGLVHLETLESVSNQCEIRVEQLLGSISEEQLAAAKQDLLAITQIFKAMEECDEDDEEDEVTEHDFLQSVSDHVDSLDITLDADKIKKVHTDINDWLAECKVEQDEGSIKEAQDIHYRAIKFLAEMTVCSVEIFHKCSQLLQLNATHTLSAYKSKAKHISSLLVTFNNEIGIITSNFCECLNTAADDSEDPDSVTPLITNVYLESTNSKTYTQDAFQLLLPVLQATALQTLQR